MMLSLVIYLWFRRDKRYIPQKKPLKLCFEKKQWSMTESTQSPTYYFDTHQILLDAGLLCLIEFKTENVRKRLVIFKDQLTLEDYRQLYLIEKLQAKKDFY